MVGVSPLLVLASLEVPVPACTQAAIFSDYQDGVKLQVRSFGDKSGKEIVRKVMSSAPDRWWMRR